jgi:GNAT superfamily N-acetyltransferase
MAEILVREAVGDEDVALVRGLMEDYGAYLAAHPAGAANMCLSGFNQELDRLHGKYAALLLATVDGVAAGCVAMRKLTQVEGGCEMKRLWVEPSFRGMRIGRRLVEEAVRWARTEGMFALYLDTISVAMPEAVGLYQSMGFERVEPYHGDCTEDVEFFRLGLGG